ncbi:MAG: beta galactosidase jelly roll domain-containing protein [Planctomycetes bacterium]|nr:beta galactosidase jelly roll domain-containing protein [Planctomycetota bacterium]
MTKRLSVYAILFSIAVAAASVQAYVPVDNDGKWLVSLNGQWRFTLNGPKDVFHRAGFDDSKWASIKVPANWEVEGFEEPQYRKLNDGTGLYRRQFSVPSAWKSRRTIVRFEGVLYGFQFWVNGKKAGSFNSAFNRSEFDISDLVRFDGSNMLSVRVDRRSRGSDFDVFDAWCLAGIYRDVEIFSVPATHVHDYVLATKTQPDWSEATVLCDFTIASGTGDLRETVGLTAELIDPSGAVAGTKTKRIRLDKATNTARLSFHVDKPRLWSAENPRLYELNVCLATADGSTHVFKRKIGLRQVTIDGDVLKLNHRPIKIRGVNHHDIHPEVGRAMRLEHYRQDVELMKKGNINAVRTSHYPPHPMFLSLCDKYGLYIIDEVPFGGGEEHLKDKSYLPDLLARAEATVSRDRNHPSVIIWSIGNENPVTPNVIATIKKVKQLDATRPTLLPGAGSGGSYKTELPDCIDIMAPHYPYTYPAPERGRWGLSEAAEATDIKRPILCTEYNHSLGTAFEGLKDHWEMMEKYDRFAGGCIWHFQNQGLKRKTTGRKVAGDTKTRLTISKDKALSADTWIDDDTILDSRGGSGTDGIVDADRFPQADYWLTRTVYSPVVIPMEEIRIAPGKQRLEIPVLNRYDFTNLNRIRGYWNLIRDGKTIKSESLTLAGRPHQKTSTVVNLQVGRDFNRHDYLLELSFIDSAGHPIVEHSIRLLPKKGEVDFSQRLTDLSFESLQLKSTPKMMHISFSNYSFDIDKTVPNVAIKSTSSRKTLLTGPMLRVGRTPAMAEYRNYPRYNIKFWEPPLLRDAKLLDCRIDALGKDTASIHLKLEYARADSDSQNQSVIADLHWTVSQNWIDLDYELSPKNADGCFLELGLAFQLPQETNQLHWLGDGPFNSYPGQSQAARRGIWHIKPEPITNPHSRYYQGNRAGVDIAAVTDIAGNGLGVIMDDATVSLERCGDGMVFSHLLRVAGKGNKTGGMMTLLPVKADEITSVRGSLRFIVLAQDKWPELFGTLFGLLRRIGSKPNK